MSDEIKKQEQLKEVSTCVWQMYQHVFEGRTKLENKLNYFLAINTVLLLVVLELTHEQLKAWSLFHIVPVFLLTLPVVLLLVNFIARPLRVPWFEKEPLTGSLGSGEFYANWVATIFGSAYGSFAYQNRIGKLIKVCLALVLSALTWLCILLILNLCESPTTSAERFAVLLMLTVGAGSVVWLMIQNRAEFPHDLRSAEVHAFLSQWIGQVQPQDKQHP